MHLDSHPVLLLAALGVNLFSFLYVAFAIGSVAVFRRRPRSPGGFQPPVTILKPVCGLEPGLYENLRSFCDQDYPVFQVVFGVRDAADEAIEVIERLIREFPERDLALVVNDRMIGTNSKVSNLANLDSFAKHDVLVVADSDMRVDRHYLTAVSAPFEDPGVGAVTCLYKGRPSEGLASTLGAMFINEWFVPSVLVALAFRDLSFCFGATMAVRRPALESVGGFEALASHLADDYTLGRLISQEGYRVVLSPYVVDNIVFEQDLKALFRHELRWARAVFSVRPLGYALSVVTHAVPIAVLTSIIVEVSVGWRAFEFGVVTTAVLLRISLHFMVRSVLDIRQPAAPWLVPIRDILSFAIWGASFFARQVEWRGQSFAVSRDGQLALVTGRQPQ